MAASLLSVVAFLFIFHQFLYFYRFVVIFATVVVNFSAAGISGECFVYIGFV